MVNFDSYRSHLALLNPQILDIGLEIDILPISVFCLPTGDLKQTMCTPCFDVIADVLD